MASSIETILSLTDGISSKLDIIGTSAFGLSSKMIELNNVVDSTDLSLNEELTEDFETLKSSTSSAIYQMQELSKILDSGALKINDENLSEELNRIKSSAKELTAQMDTLGKDMSSIDLSVGGDLEEQLTQITEKASTLSDEIINLYTTLDDSPLDATNTKFKLLDGYIATATNKAKNFVDKLKTIGKTSINGIINQFKNLKANIKSITDIGSLVYLGKTIYNSVSNAVKSATELSDTIAQTTARLNLTNDGLQTTSELWEKIKVSADNSRGSLIDTANAVASLGQRTSGIFENTDEIIAFSETLNKMFVIAGASSSEIANATLQLTQALGSGVLRGDELNSIFEQAPNIIQSIADYIGEPIGAIRDLASEGKITADIVKNALMSATDEVNSQFESMPKTFGQLVTGLKNDLIMAFMPLSEALSNIANSSSFNDFVNLIITGVSSIIPVVTAVFSFISGFLGGLWQVISPVFEWIGNIFMVIGSNLQALSPYLQAVGVGLGVIAGVILAIKVALNAVAIVKGVLITLQTIWNAVTMANPIVLIITLAVGAIMLLTDVILKATGESESFGESVVTVFAAIAGAGAWLAELFKGTYTWLFSWIEQGFWKLIGVILKGVNKLVVQIDNILGTELSAKVEGIIETISENEQKAAARRDTAFDGLGSAYQDTFDAVKNFFETPEIDINSSETDGLLGDKPLDLGSDLAFENLSSNVSTIADNTSDLNDNVKYLADIAERKYVGDYHNSVKGDTTLNLNFNGNVNNREQVIAWVKQALYDEVNANASGVYS